MSAREAILGRLRAAPRAQVQPAEPAPREGVREGDRATLARRFTEALSAAGGRVARVPDRAALSRLLVRELDWTDQAIVLCSADPIVHKTVLPVRDILDRTTVLLWDPRDGDPDWLRTRAAGAAAGVTGADALLADTGTVVLAATVARPRVLSLLPRRHVVIATTDQLLPDLETWVERRALVRSPDSCTAFVTGPSRTADIEKVLITGMHGPRELTVVLIGPD
ncbi:MAG: hypothetical protein AMXMBFR64_13550 [Myxococcales bacterium]